MTKSQTCFSLSLSWIVNPSSMAYLLYSKTVLLLQPWEKPGASTSSSTQFLGPRLYDSQPTAKSFANRSKIKFIHISENMSGDSHVQKKLRPNYHPTTFLQLNSFDENIYCYFSDGILQGSLGPHSFWDLPYVALSSLLPFCATFFTSFH